jgi:hypothetical protein
MASYIRFLNNFSQWLLYINPALGDLSSLNLKNTGAHIFLSFVQLWNVFWSYLVVVVAPALYLYTANDITLWDMNVIIFSNLLYILSSKSKSYNEIVLVYYVD